MTLGFLLAIYHIATAYREIFWYNGENNVVEKVRENEPIIKRNE